MQVFLPLQRQKVKLIITWILHESVAFMLSSVFMQNSVIILSYHIPSVAASLRGVGSCRYEPEAASIAAAQFSYQQKDAGSHFHTSASPVFYILPIRRSMFDVGCWTFIFFSPSLPLSLSPNLPIAGALHLFFPHSAFPLPPSLPSLSPYIPLTSSPNLPILHKR